MASSTASPGYRAGVSRGIGLEVLPVAIDDASRLACTELLPDEKKESACAFLDRDLTPSGARVSWATRFLGQVYVIVS